MRSLLIMSCALWIAVSGCQAEKKSDSGSRVVETKPRAVSVETIKSQAIGQSFDFVGELRAQNSVELASKLSGRIKSIRVRMGDFVKKGDLLVEIEDSHLRAQLGEAKASLAVAQASIKRAVVEEKNASNELLRKETLIEKDLITRQEMDNVRSRQEADAASLDLARAQAAQAKARIELLQDQLSDARIRSPLHGRVEVRYLDAGAVVSPGTAILRLIDVDPIIARFQVPERYLGEIMARAGDGATPLIVTAQLEAYPSQTFHGRVVRTSPALDKATRAASIEAEFPNAEGRLAPGMYCRLKLDLGIQFTALLVPLRALLNGSGTGPSANYDESGTVGTQARVYVVRQNRAEQVRISIGERQGEYRRVLAGLEPGDKLVVEGQSLLKDGSNVEIIKLDGKAVAQGEP